MVDATQAGNAVSSGAQAVGVQAPVAQAAGAEVTTVLSAGKKWYESKVVWVNAIAVVALVAQSYFGYSIPAAYEATALGLLNLILRAITKDPITW